MKQTMCALLLGIVALFFASVPVYALSSPQTNIQMTVSDKGGQVTVSDKDGKSDSVAINVVVDSLVQARMNEFASNPEPFIEKMMGGSFDEIGDVAGKVMLIPILFIIFVMAAPIILIAVIVIVLITSHYSSKKRKYALMQAAINSGQPISADVIKELEVGKKKKSSLDTGIISISFGVGIFILFWILIDIKMAFVGLVFVLVGIGQLLSYFLMKKEENKEQTTAAPLESNQNDEVQQ
ncbi:MAG: DUF6249 domain-containing protein [Bacteroidales bacterium]|nr:DUF6249 domain-containing protein [Bacteroidales bacterium]MDD4823553.1 DUF6249 domain-containing protein [Bacteroidales bacterium]